MMAGISITTLAIKPLVSFGIRSSLLRNNKPQLTLFRCSHRINTISYETVLLRIVGTSIRNEKTISINSSRLDMCSLHLLLKRAY